MGHPQPLFHLFSVISINSAILPQQNWNIIHLVCAAGNQTHDFLFISLLLQPLDQGSCPPLIEKMFIGLAHVYQLSYFHQVWSLSLDLCSQTNIFFIWFFKQILQIDCLKTTLIVFTFLRALNRDMCGKRFLLTPRYFYFKKPHSNPNGSYWDLQCSWTLTPANSMQVSTMQ